MSTLPGQSMTIRPCDGLHGTITVPGDKSISHRVAMMAGMSHGDSNVTGFLASEDCLNSLHAMEAFGARSHRLEDGSILIQGNGGHFMEPVAPLDLGNSGTSIRLLAGLAAGQDMEVVLTGDESLCSRPMKRIQEPLLKMGAEVSCLGEGGTAPVHIKGGKLRGMEYPSPVASAQVKSCILLAGLFAEGTTTVIEPRASRDHTERLFESLGLNIKREGLRVTLEGYGPKGPKLDARDWDVPGDFSSAAFFITAAAAMPGACIQVDNLGLNPGRAVLLDVLRRMGADLEIRMADDGQAEPRGTVIVRGAKLKGTVVEGAEIPGLIDELPLVAVAGALAEGETEIRDAAELRVKESDRISVMAENLAAVGVRVEEQDAGMTVYGADAIVPKDPIRSYGDHRMAMAMAIVGLFSEKPLCVHNTLCVNTSYPRFWEDLKGLGVDVE